MDRESAVTAPRRRGRPRKDQTLPDAPRARLLRQGVALLTEKGFSALGIEEVLAAAEVPKGSFYYYFDSKEAFGFALIEAYADYFAAKLDRWFEDQSRTPLDRVRAFIADAREGMARHDFRRGCLVGNLGQEMGVLPSSFRDRLTAVLRDWEERTTRCLRAAQEAGEISADADCARLAEFFWIGWEGAVLRAKLEHDPAALDTFAGQFLAMIEHDNHQRQR
ncbi:TetR/AcrR family transcriptional regulator [Dietzia lutea]|uniref:TetR family transcriptional regulator n=1 Tax=Dietzia lutea TaxID=546160 RepID=A0A2S1R3W0_9ACTN|nr:TetR/AcrR family transcriptional regulator [Dietzia lutea]AWH90941.1 TetR family transcriptional regulator [Dietzia lutea]